MLTRRTIRLVGIICGAAAAAFLLAVVVFAATADPVKYKAEAISLVKAATGRDLAFDGDLRLTFFPRLGVKTGGVRLGNAPGFDAGTPFARASAVEVSVRLLPLLVGRVAVGRVRLDGLEVHLERDAQGRANWADLTGPDTPDSGPSFLSKLSLGGLRVTDGALYFADRQAGTSEALKHLDADVAALGPGRPAKFAASGDFLRAKPRLAARLRLTGTAVLDVGPDRHAFRDLALSAAAEGDSVPGGKGEFRLGLADLDVDFAHQTARGANLSFSAYGATGTGGFAATNLRDGPDVAGTISVPAFDGRALSAALTGVSGGPAYRRISVSLAFRSGRGMFEIPKFSAALDDARVTASLRVTGLVHKTCSFDADVRGLDADRFLSQRKSKDGIFPVETLRDLGLHGTLTAERLKIKGVRFASLKARVAAQDGVLAVGPFAAGLYGGTLAGTTRLDVRGERPELTQSLAASGVQLGTLLADLRGRPGGVSGVLDVRIPTPLVCAGNDAAALKRSLCGRVRLSIRNGVFPGVNLTGVVSDARRAGGGAAGHTGAGQSTRFGSLDVTAAIRNGVASFDDLDFKAPFLRATGSGSVDLSSRQVDALVKAKIAATARGQGGVSAREAWGIVVPVRVTGPWDNLSYDTQVLRAIGENAANVVGGVARAAGGVIKGTATGVSKTSHSLLRGLKKIF